MAATNESSIRVTADTASFQADMRRAAKKLKGVAGQMGRALGDSLSDGFDEGKKSANEMLGSVRDITSQVLTLGGAVSGGAMVASAVQAKKANIALANVLSSVRDRTVSVAEAQQLVGDAALATGESMADIRVSAQNLTSAAKAGMDVGDALVRSTKMAQRFNVEGDTMSEIWGRVIGGGFAGSVDEAEALIEQVGVTMLNTGVAMEDAFNPNDMMEFFAKMKQFGVPIQSGIALLENMEGTVRDLGEALELPEELGEMLGSTKGLEGITAASKLTSKELSKNFSIAENLVTVLKAGPEAFKVLQAGLGEKATIGFEKMLGVDIIEAASRRKLKGEQLQNAVDRVEDAFTREAKVQFDAAAAAARDAEIADSAATDFQNAITMVEQSFRTEEVTGAIKEVAEALPQIAEGIGNFVSYAVKNPWTTITGIVGAKLALAVGGAAVQSAVARAAAAMFARAAAVQAATTAASVATQGATTLGVGGAVGAAGAAGGTGAAIAAGATVAGGVLAAGAGGALVGTGIRKFGGIETAEREEFEGRASAGMAVTDAELARSSGDAARMQAALDGLGAAKKNLEDSVSMSNSIFGAMASAVTGVKSPEERRAEAAAKVEAESARLIAALAKIGGAAEGAARGLDTVKGKAAGATRGTDQVPQATGNAAVQG